jgi:hypothetical protein
LVHPSRDRSSFAASFRYPGVEDDALRSISCGAAGQTIALIGTTDLANRRCKPAAGYDVTGGAILINGTIFAA